MLSAAFVRDVHLLGVIWKQTLATIFCDACEPVNRARRFPISMQTRACIFTVAKRPLPNTTIELFRIGSAIGQSSTPCGTLSWHRRGSRTSGEIDVGRPRRRRSAPATEAASPPSTASSVARRRWQFSERRAAHEAPFRRGLRSPAGGERETEGPPRGRRPAPERYSRAARRFPLGLGSPGKTPRAHRPRLWARCSRNSEFCLVRNRRSRIWDPRGPENHRS
jgi:hypothetical protein